MGDFLLVNKLAYGLHIHRVHFPLTTSLPSFTLPLFHGVHREDVIVFEFPGGKDEVKPSESVNYIKRCIGLPGDTVEIRDGRVFVNRIEMRFPPLGKHTSPSSWKSLATKCRVVSKGFGIQRCQLWTDCCTEAWRHS